MAQRYPPIAGGGETHIQNLADGLSGRGYDVTVLTSDPGAEARRYRHAGVSIEYVDGFWAACQSLECKDAVVDLYARLSGRAWDLVHVFNHVPALLPSWLRAAVPQPVCVSLFETQVPAGRVFGLWGDYALEKALQRSLFGQLAAERVICGSEAYRRWALAGGAAEERIRVVPFGTETRRFARAGALRAVARQARGLGGEFAVLVPARPVRRKRIEDALRALALVRRERPGVRLMLTLPDRTADSEYVGELRLLAADLGQSDAVWWERGPGWQDMPELYAAADAVLLPSSHEGFGIALIEGMAAGRPVITSDVEGHDEIVTHAETGLLYPAGDVEALADRLRAVASGAGVPGMVERARELARARFDVAAMVAGHHRVYRELVE
ncbi:glycosyltransferase family 4 protein [Streptomyces johnsoniae]|uniref:D-inositol 3-phosphate glycosyltransferase n=1 Tax=Streptomyces johnsoniae TaxID=3075532 RepID=A0ABU2S1X3_9ACTN|nr:glycosyltransferase family 4 protein [Streptomyces sp. DSM 41886]MDT0442711.1 glycosyltransferase family 4 protein [Streptomyces sp. DSM 41886]